MEKGTQEWGQRRKLEGGRSQATSGEVSGKIAEEHTFWKILEKRPP